MATLNNIYNLVECGLGAVLGTGTKGCKQFLKKATSLWIVPDGFEFDGDETLDFDYARQLQAEGKLIVLKGIKTFTDNSSDDIIETLEDGTKQVATLGLYEFAVTFINGLAFHTALHSLNSFGSYNVLFVDRDGNILGTESTNGSLKGFSLNMLQGMKLSFPTDSTGQKEGIYFQLSNRSEFDTGNIFISGQQLGSFSPQNLDGINEVVLSYDSVPTDGATSIVVNAKLKQNGQPFVGADDLGNWLLTLNNATLTPTGVTETTDGQYDFTVSAVSADDAITAALYDSSENRNVIELDSDLFKSNTVSTIVV